ncbi:unnamed protein product [Tuber aestivum]|uniref:Uncharacterized protein n=1 Tax=Tuber aestivum TaxID=59557 RepID=A0A292Q623_9PEZI|nr:unnamed protein product [Tuber aestivum]
MYPSTVMTAQIPDVKPTLFGLSSPRSPTKGYTCAFPSWPSRPCLDRRMPWEDGDDDDDEESHECVGRKDRRCACPTATATAAPVSSPTERWDGRSVSSTCTSSTSSTSTSTHVTEGKVEALINGFEKLPLQPRSPKAPSRPARSLLSLAILGKAGGDM